MRQNFYHILPKPKRNQLLLAEDDEDDVFLLRESFRQIDPTLEVHRVRNGEELLAYLSAEPERSLANTVLLLDLNMPRKSGQEALREIRADDRLKTLPVVVFSTSRCEGDVNLAYALGVNSFVTKPSTNGGFMQAVRSIHEYWFKTACLPVE
jgi:two-component system response regulator